MFYNFMYLNTDLLNSYIAVLEGGLRESGSTKSTGAKGFGGSLGISGASLKAGTSSGNESTVTVSDHDASRFHRLLQETDKRGDELNWHEILEPDSDFTDRQMRLGEMISWECDVFMPQVVSLLLEGSQMNQMLTSLDSFFPAMQSFGVEAPDDNMLEKIDTMGKFANMFKTSPVVVGDDEEETTQKVIGRLDPAFIKKDLSSLDDRFRIIGKFQKRISGDKWYPLLALPGQGREQRRKNGNNVPKTEQEKNNFVQGPAVVIDVLAIFQ